MRARNVIIPVSIVAGIAVIGIGIAALGNSAAAVTYAETTEIQQKTIENKISVSGTVESSDATNVYSKLAYPVESVNVKVGDTVKKGDVLCTIDTEELQQQILQQQAAVESSGINTDYNLSEAERQYNEALEKYENGENPSIVSAQRAVEQAEKNLEDAKRQENIGKDTTLPSNMQSADANLKNAKANYDDAVRAYDNAVEAYNKAVSELEPENYPANVKAVYDTLAEYKESYRIVDAGLYNVELQKALTDYENAKKAYEEAKDNSERLALSAPELINSESQLKLQELSEAYAAAKQNYEAMVSKYDKENLEKQIESTQNQLDSLIESLEAARDSAEAAVENAEAAVENAKRAYDNAADSYGSAESQNGNAEEDYSIAVKNAEEALEQAKDDYERTVSQVESELASLKKQAEQQRTVSGLNDPQVIMLQNLKDKLDYAVITAPCDGIVTAVNAEEGAVSPGALFTIENINDLKITSSVGEYDIPYVSEGMSATIRCDALDGAEYSGKVTDVAPTSISVAATAAGSSSGAAASYKIETDVDGEDGKLLVGMNTKVEIISDKRENALTVTYDALTTDENGNDAVYIAEKDESGVWHAKLVTVKIGLETDYEIEIISDSLSAGMPVLTDTTMLSDGAVVNINENANNETEQVTE